MNQTVNVVLYKDKSDDLIGTIKIRITENRKSKYINLKIRLHEKYWNPKSARVRKTPDLDYIELNSQIETKLKELETVNNRIEYVNKATSFLGYHKKIINRTINEGTSIKHQTIHNKLVAYLQTLNRVDLDFGELDTDFIWSFRKYLLQDLEENTATHYLKMFKGVMNKAAKENVYHYTINPFLSINFTTSKVRKESLTDEEIKRLIRLEIALENRLYRIKVAFLAQMFAQGMRVSDLFLLSWGKYKDGYINYKMFKTNKNINVFISENLWTLLIIQVKAFVKRNNIKLSALENIEVELQMKQKQAEEILRNEHGIYSGYHLLNYATIGIPELKEVELLQGQLRVSYKNIIGYLATNPEYKECLIFDFLEDKALKGIDLDKLAGDNYKKVYRFMKNKTIVYNRNLKEIQELAKIHTTLTTHLARHTYASQLLNSIDPVSIFDIAQALGHSDIKITQVYLSGFDTKRLEKHNTNLSNKFKM
jgi:integrase